MNHSDILKTALDLLDGDRAEKHGGISLEAFEGVSIYWQEYLRGVMKRDETDYPILQAYDIPHLMMLYKIARMQQGQFNNDDYVDAAGYAAIAGALTKDYINDVKRIREASEQEQVREALIATNHPLAAALDETKD